MFAPVFTAVRGEIPVSPLPCLYLRQQSGLAQHGVDRLPQGDERHSVFPASHVPTCIASIFVCHGVLADYPPDT